MSFSWSKALMRRRWSVFLILLLGAGCGSENASTGAAPAHPGAPIYLRSCFSCHASGLAGAPRAGDAVAWEERLAKGREQLLKNTIEGVPPGMPARGMCSNCSDEQLADAIDYMIKESGLK